MEKIKKIFRRFLPWIDEYKKIYYIYTKANKSYKSGKTHLADYYSYKILRKYKCHISGRATILDNLILPHPISIVIGAGVKIGKNVTIYQNVTLGRKNKDIAEYPTIGDNVTIYCNSTIIGNVKIGNNAVIGCNSVVLRDVKDGEVVSGIVK